MRLGSVRGLALLAASLLAPGGGALAVPIVNGDFADGTPLAGWTASDAAVTEPTGDFAQITADDDTQHGLEQSFTLLSVPAVLSFDFAFSTATTGPAVAFPDAFAAQVVIATGALLDILVVDLNGAVPDPLHGDEAANGALPIDVALDPTVTIPGFTPFAGGTLYAGRVRMTLPAAALGQEATLYFDLYGQADGAATRVALDNLSQDPASAPVAPTPALLLAGIAAAALSRRRNRPMSRRMGRAQRNPSSPRHSRCPGRFEPPKTQAPLRRTRPSEPFQPKWQAAVGRNAAGGSAVYLAASGETRP